MMKHRRENRQRALREAVNLHQLLNISSFFFPLGFMCDSTSAAFHLQASEGEAEPGEGFPLISFQKAN